MGLVGKERMDGNEHDQYIYSCAAIYVYLDFANITFKRESDSRMASSSWVCLNSCYNVLSSVAPECL